MIRLLNIIKSISLTYLTLAFLLLLILPSCKDDAPAYAERKVNFTASLRDIGQIKTRVDSSYINIDKFNENFYIQMCFADESGEVGENFGTYVIPSGYEGRLESVDTNEPLMWKYLNTDHVFYSWTIPWDDDYYKDGVNVEPVTVTFHDSSDETGFDEHKNNQIYETFIGAKTRPYTYKQHGKYVDLTFYHLVSRIEIVTFQLTEPSGAIQRDLKADVTFLNMPTEATFYPHPDDPSKRPYVKPGQPDSDTGITYFIDNDPTTIDLFYICPEIDFRTIEFQVKIKSEKYKDRETYYGSFADIKFVRINGNDLDIGDGSDDYVLHAGEEMKLNINLIPGIGPGLAVIIDEWSTQKPNEAEFHPYPGLYSDSELNELRNLFMQLSSVDDEEVLEKIRNLFYLYGSEGPHGEKYLNLYNDLELKSDANIFPVWKEYILNGQGHSIFMKTNSGNYWGTGNKPYFNIGPCRNIYFTDGNHTIYIDNDGKVWVTDPETGNLKETDNQLEDLNTYQGGIYNSYDINAETGEIRYSRYFNNKITG